MSLVISSEGKARNSSHDHVFVPSTSPSIVKSHSSRGVRGVGPAERTGKPSTRYWPGGTRTSPSARLRRPRKPREMNPLLTNVPPAVVLRREYIYSCTPPKAGSNASSSKETPSLSRVHSRWHYNGRKAFGNKREKLLPDGVPRYVCLYDNGGVTTERYTAVFTRLLSL